MKSLLLLCLTLPACMTVPGTHHKGLFLISRAQELSMGEEAYQDVLKKEPVSNDARLNAILTRVGTRIAAVTPVTDFHWEFKLIESKEKNAFCLPGGKVVVYTGILPSLQNEGALAIVLGHEISHAVARHGAQRVSEGLAEQGLLGLIGMGMGDSAYRDVVLKGLEGVGALGVALPHSRAQETEADTLGIRYAAQAGYDPAEGPRFWERFSKDTGDGKPPVFLSTHPSDESRIENLQRLQAEAQGLYAQSPKYGTGEKL